MEWHVERLMAAQGLEHLEIWLSLRECLFTRDEVESIVEHNAIRNAPLRQTIGDREVCVAHNVDKVARTEEPFLICKIDISPMDILKAVAVLIQAFRQMLHIVALVLILHDAISRLTRIARQDRYYASVGAEAIGKKISKAYAFTIKTADIWKNARVGIRIDSRASRSIETLKKHEQNIRPIGIEQFSVNRRESIGSRIPLIDTETQEIEHSLLGLLVAHETILLRQVFLAQ